MSADPVRRIRVLVVEDSPAVRELIVHLLGADPAIQVAGTARNGEEAVEAVASGKPDVVTMDLHMPKMNGMEATRRIMESHPVPIIIVSGSAARDEVTGAFALLEAGALAVVEKPPGIGQPGHEAAARELVQTVKLMSEVKVVKRWRRRESTPRAAAPVLVAPARAAQQMRAVAVGASTGGPIILKIILAALPARFPVPVLIVQHIAAGFTEGLVGWLAAASGFPVQVARHNQYPVAGHAYVAPDGRHMGLARDGRIALGDGAPQNGHRPSVGYLFQSVAAALGANAVGVLLTGMGRDGASELKAMREAGAVTIAQDRASSTVHGMPGEAIALGAAAHVLAPAQIAAALSQLAVAGRSPGDAR